MSTLWVQSKYSKDAMKFEVTEGDTYYHYWQPPDRGFVVPKEEYIPCDPPEKWEECTVLVARLDDKSVETLNGLWTGLPVPWIKLPPGHRWAYSQKDPYALVIERKVP